MGAVASYIIGEEVSKKYVVKQDSENLWSVANVVDPEIDTADSEELITEFSHQIVHDDLADFVDISIQRLRVLRHPNVLKFLSSYASEETVYLLTELVSPLEVVIKALGHDEAIKGFRDVARGLQFLHEKALLSHNNLHIGNIFVRETTWCWKIAGFECTLELTRVDTKFLEDIALVRKTSVIPPEDKVKGFSGVSKSPPYARDMWAFGQLVVAIVTRMGSNSDDGQLLDHTKSCLLNDDPERRITAGQVLRKPWLRNELTDTMEFLEQLTMKKSAEKTEFFRSLPGRLLTLSSQTLCRHIVPLLLTPLVMVEPAARQYLWKHLFTPVTGDRPRHFNPEEVCPLIAEGDYRRYVLLHIIRLLESRERHIRQILLENLSGFTTICTDEDMETIVLPQVLVGLQETDDDLVAATLQGLSKMVPVLGADIVLGTARKSIFVNTKPKRQCDKEEDDTPVSSMPFISHVDEEPSITQPVSVVPSLSASELRRKENEARREAMRSKGKTAIRKIGTKALSTSEDDRTASVSRDSCSTADITATVGEDYTSNEDSMSHTGANDMDEDFKAWEDEEQNFDEDKEESLKSSSLHTNSLNSPTVDDDWNKSEWPSIEPQTSSWERTGDTTALASSSKLAASGSTNGASAFNGNTSSPLLKAATSLRSSKTSLSATESDSSLKGRLKQSDIERLEEQAKWASMEVDYFADMQPVITNTKPPPSVSLLAGKETSKSTSTEPTPSSTTNKLNYVPDEEVNESTEGWNDDFDEWDNNDS